MKSIFNGLHSLPIFLLIVFCVSCGSIDFKNTVLTDAERIINRYPDSALCMIESVDVADLTATDRARYVYLRTRACDKLHRPITWPDEMRAAADHLDSLLQDYPDTLALVHYYVGIANKVNHRPKDAVAGFLKSLEYQGAASSRIGMMTYRNLHWCYLEQDLRKEAKESSFKSLRIAKELNDSVTIITILENVALDFGQLNILDSAFYYASIAWKIALSMDDSLCISDEAHTLSVIFRANSEYDSALYYNDYAFRMHPKGKKKNTALSFSRSAIFVQLGSRDSALFYLNSLLEDSRPQYQYYVYLQLYDLEKSTGHFSEASVYADSVIYYRKLLSEEDHSQEIKDLIVSHRETLRRKEQEKYYYIISFIIIGLVLSIVVVCLVLSNQGKKRMLAKNRELSELRARIVALKGEMSVQMEQGDKKMDGEKTSEEDVPASVSPEAASTAQLTQAILQLQEQQIGLCKEMLQRRPEYGELEALRVHPSPIVTNERRDLLVNAIVNAFSDVYQELLSEYPTLNNQDCLYCLMSYMHYSTKLCAALTGNSEEAIRQRKYRIKKRIRPEAFDLFFGN